MVDVECQPALEGSGPLILAVGDQVNLANNAKLTHPSPPTRAKMCSNMAANTI